MGEAEHCREGTAGAKALRQERAPCQSGGGIPQGGAKDAARPHREEGHAAGPGGPWGGQRPGLAIHQPGSVTRR